MNDKSEEAEFVGYNRTPDNTDERIVELQGLLERSQARHVLTKRVADLERQIKLLERRLAKEQSWTMSLEGRAEELEHVLGVVTELITQAIAIQPGRIQDIKLEKVKEQLEDVMHRPEMGSSCPTCRRPHANEDSVD